MASWNHFAGFVGGLANRGSQAEVQAKKHFTAEELSMRRAEMARRRRNLSEKRNEEVKVSSISQLGSHLELLTTVYL
jgi:hypothetical protein